MLPEDQAISNASAGIAETIVLVRDRSCLRLTWLNGDVSDIEASRLRGACRCAECARSRSMAMTARPGTIKAEIVVPLEAATPTSNERRIDISPPHPGHRPLFSGDISFNEERILSVRQIPRPTTDSRRSPWFMSAARSPNSLRRRDHQKFARERLRRRPRAGKS